jgi:hypothetical protein
MQCLGQVKDENHLHMAKIPSPTPFSPKSFQIQKENTLAPLRFATVPNSNHNNKLGIKGIIKLQQKFKQFLHKFCINCIIEFVEQNKKNIYF